MRRLLAIVASLCSLAALGGDAASSLPAMFGSGSSLAAPVYQDALFAYEASGDWEAYISAHPSNDTSSSDFTAGFTSSGSGAGKNALMANTIDFAGSDSAFSDLNYQTFPDLQQLPSMAAAVAMVYNLPLLQAAGVGALRLDRATLPLIFSGNLTSWTDPRLLALQTPAVAALLPNTTIVVVVRGESSGTTDIFTRALSSFSPAWASQVGHAELPNWPGRVVKIPQNIGVASYVEAM